jgi:hypothetical protein
VDAQLLKSTIIPLSDLPAVVKLLEDVSTTLQISLRRCSVLDYEDAGAVRTRITLRRHSRVAQIHKGRVYSR